MMSQFHCGFMSSRIAEDATPHTLTNFPVSLPPLISFASTLAGSGSLPWRTVTRFVTTNALCRGCSSFMIPVGIRFSPVMCTMSPLFSM